MKKPAAPKGNFISEWFGQRIYPEVKLDSGAISGKKWGVCPFLTSTKRETTQCIKGENAFGVCTINSLGAEGRKDWLVCPYRVIDSEIVKTGCATIFGEPLSSPPIPISILGDEKGIAILEKTLDAHQHAFIFFQDKLGGEISISGTPASPEVAFDITVVEISRPESKALKVGRYGFIEIQTMDFHGSYKAAVANLRDAHRLHGKGFPKALSQNQMWASKNIEGPNIANVFKRTFYQTLLKFELSKEGAAAGTVLALPEAVWDSWQPFLGRPKIERVTGSEFRVAGTDNVNYHGTNAWVFVFDLDDSSAKSISPVVIKSRIRVSATDLVQHAFVTVPKNMLHWATSDDVLLNRIRDRIRRTIRTIPIE
jgi:Restriction endonuclease NotI